jgi:hypothetical protein
VGDANDYAGVSAVVLEACRKRSVDAIFAVRNRITMFAFQTLREKASASRRTSRFLALMISK